MSPEPHYEHIPAQLGGVAEDTDSCNNLLGGTTGPDRGACLKSGQYDKLTKAENPYVMEPQGNTMYAMGPEARTRREMYTQLPSATELRRIADE